MRLAFALVTVLFTLLATAQNAYAQTRIDIEPTRPVNCLEGDYPFVNMVYDIEKVSETATEVYFSFKTAHGSCRNFAFVNRSIGKYPTALVDRKKMMLFKSSGVKTSVQKTADDEVEVVLKFNKEKVFKKSDGVKFIMAFYPDGVYFPQPCSALNNDCYFRQATRNLRYFWEITLTQDASGVSALQINVVSAK